MAPSAAPDFLLVLVALAGSMRLSLMKAAHVAASREARQEIRFAPTARRDRRDDKKGDAGGGRCRHYCMQLLQFGVLLLKNYGGFR
jgi:hypothetical protein